MKAKFDGLDYHLILTPSELRSLRETNIVTQLQSLDEQQRLGKRINLRIGEASNPDGIDFEFFPEDEGIETLEECMGIYFTINERAYKHLENNHMAATTYLKTENKIRIVVQPL